MKVKSDFVTNSSSCSFIIDYKKVSIEQFDGLMKWVNSDKNLDDWHIYLNDRIQIEGFTVMNNNNINECGILKELCLEHLIEFY